MRPFIFILTSILLVVNGSLPAQQVITNFDIDTSWEGFSEVIHLWKQYLKAPDDSTASVYWNPSEIEKLGFEHYNIQNAEFTPVLRTMGRFYRSQILSIQQFEEGFKLKNQFYISRGDTIETLAIVDIWAIHTSKGLKLSNAIFQNLKKGWNNKTVGYIHFHYPHYHSFNALLAEKQNTFITEKLPAIFGTEPDTVHFYFADTFEEIQQLKGFNYIVGLSGSVKPSGKAAHNNWCYSGGTGEYYPHELVHLFVDDLYPGKHAWTSEGLATYLGGSRGKSLDWHLIRTHTYLAAHPEIDLNTMLDLITLDEYTGYRYALGGFIIHQLYKKGGWEMVKEFMSPGSEDSDYYAKVEKHLGVKRSALNSYIRNQLKNYVQSRPSAGSEK